MAWRGVHISRPARLSVADGQMVVDQDDGAVRLALEDVAWLVLDTPQASLTAALLSACMEAGIAVVTTDATHMPNGVALAFHAHHRQAAMAWTQVGLGAPLRKRLWQRLVCAKIANQAMVLETTGHAEAPALAAMARHVGSGDPDNVEARAAGFYWPRLFADFRRDDGSDRRNALLNYGYAVLRSGLARALVARGLLPAFGLHHRSAANPFNLADDVIEPFRPLVDRLVKARAGERAAEPLTLDDRRALAGVLGVDVVMGGETMTALAATEAVAAGLARAIAESEPAALVLPEPIR